MNRDPFESSDSCRSARPLKNAQLVTFEEPLVTELGGQLLFVTVAYETYGTLDDRRANAILICPALSGDCHVASHEPSDDPGWWEIVVGPGKAIDTDKYFVVCPSVLGGCRGTTGPNSVDPATGKPYGADFPTITIRDMVEVQLRVMEHLGIQKWLAVIGGSMGGQQVLTWAAYFPDRLQGAVALATSARLDPQALAFDVIGRNAILRDPNFQGGQYYENGSGPAVGLALARMIGHITYLSPDAMRRKFEADRLQPREVPTQFENHFSVGAYLAYQGDRFVERFDANSYIKLSLAMDLFNLGRTPEELTENLSRSQCHWLVVSFSSDWLFPPKQSREIVRTLVGLCKPVSYCNVTSTCGHDAFLLPDDLGTYGELMRAFLARLLNPPGMAGEEVEDACTQSAVSICRSARIDYDRIVELIPSPHAVLDLGCGSGSLLAMLRRSGCARIMGVDIEQQAVLDCVRGGIPVIHADLNEGLGYFADGQFDTVVLSLTLQVIRDIERTISEILRVGRQCIVSFPNFGYVNLRKMLMFQGRAPKSPGLLHYEWYDTPNLRFFTLLDFEEFCQLRGIHIRRRIALETESDREVPYDEQANLLADMAIFVIRSQDPRSCGAEA